MLRLASAQRIEEAYIVKLVTIQTIAKKLRAPEEIRRRVEQLTCYAPAKGLFFGAPRFVQIRECHGGKRYGTRIVEYPSVAPCLGITTNLVFLWTKSRRISLPTQLSRTTPDHF